MNGNNETKASVMFPCVKCRTLNKLEILLKAAPAEPEKEEEPGQTKQGEVKPDGRTVNKGEKSDSIRPDSKKGNPTEAGAGTKRSDSEPSKAGASPGEK